MQGKHVASRRWFLIIEHKRKPYGKGGTRWNWQREPISKGGSNQSPTPLQHPTDPTTYPPDPIVTRWEERLMTHIGLCRANMLKP